MLMNRVRRFTHTLEGKKYRENMSTEVTFRIHLNLVKRLSLVAENVNDSVVQQMFLSSDFRPKSSFFFTSLIRIS